MSSGTVLHLPFSAAPLMSPPTPPAPRTRSGLQVPLPTDDVSQTALSPGHQLSIRRRWWDSVRREEERVQGFLSLFLLLERFV